MNSDTSDSTSGELTSTQDGASVHPAIPTIEARPAIEPQPAATGGSEVSDKAWQRYRAICQIQELVVDGTVTSHACKIVGVNQATVSRWLDRIQGLPLRDPQYREAILSALEPGRSPGRHCSWEALLEVETVRQRLDTLYLSTIGAAGDYQCQDRRTAKLATTLQLFADEPECPPELSRKLRRGYQPVAFIRHLRRITPEIENRVRGPKHFGLHGLQNRRDNTLRLADGRRVEQPAGFMWEFDDMSVNQPFWSDGPDGVMLSRQGLYGIDVGSHRWLGFELVARPRESYRAEDILRFFRRLMEVHGKPDVIRLEQGVWKARAISGVRIAETGAQVEDDFTRPGWEEDQVKLLQDGLRAIGVDLVYAYTAHQKVVECEFNHLQTIIAAKATQFQNIGRHAGEFEHGAKQLRRVRSGSHHPSDVGFGHIGEIGNAVEAAITFENRRFRKSMGGTPDQIWDRDLTSRPLPALRRDDYAVFLPDHREGTARGGMVSVTVDGRRLDFRSDALIELGSGYRVSLRLDATDLSLGAAIYNRETSSANHRGYRDGQFIGWAVFEVPGPQYSVDLQEVRGTSAFTVQERYGVAEDQRTAGRRNQLRIVRTEARILPRPGQPTVRVATARDGRGNVISAESGRTEDRGRMTEGGRRMGEVGGRWAAGRMGSDAEAAAEVASVLGRRSVPDLPALRPEDLAAATECDRPVPTTDAVDEISALFGAEPEERNNQLEEEQWRQPSIEQ